MKVDAQKLRQGIKQRLEFIEFRLYWEGRINRSDIVEFFGVSVPQASNDLSQYQKLLSGNMEYDRNRKHYFPSDKFQPRFFQPDATRYLSELHSTGKGTTDPSATWISDFPDFTNVLLPRRHIDPENLKNVLRSIRDNRSLEIEYQSLSAARPKPIWRWVTAHAFGYDGMRWHTRAFCHNDKVFKDFLLSRILNIRDDGEPGASPRDDKSWNSEVEVTLTPHPGLTDNQKKVIASDFGMKRGKVAVPVRLAMLYYFLKQLNLDFEEKKRPAHEQHVVLENPEIVRANLERARGLAAA